MTVVMHQPTSSTVRYDSTTVFEKKMALNKDLQPSLVYVMARLVYHGLLTTVADCTWPTYLKPCQIVQLAVSTTLFFAHSVVYAIARCLSEFYRNGSMHSVGFWHKVSTFQLFYTAL